MRTHPLVLSLTFLCFLLVAGIIGYASGRYITISKQERNDIPQPTIVLETKSPESKPTNSSIIMGGSPVAIPSAKKSGPDESGIITLSDTENVFSMRYPSDLFSQPTDPQITYFPCYPAVHAIDASTVVLDNPRLVLLNEAEQEPDLGIRNILFSNILGTDEKPTVKKQTINGSNYFIFNEGEAAAGTSFETTHVVFETKKLKIPLCLDVKWTVAYPNCLNYDGSDEASQNRVKTCEQAEAKGHTDVENVISSFR